MPTSSDVYVVSIPHPPWERRVATLVECAEILGRLGESRWVSRIGPGGALWSLSESERLRFVAACRRLYFGQ